MSCIFCQIVAGTAPSWKVWENELAYAFLDIHPAARYHTLVIPKRHADNMFDVTEEDLLAVMQGVRTVVRLYREKLGIEHLQIINSNGREGQQDVFHLHYHVVPRRQGDGQNIRWTTHPEWRQDYDEMLRRLQ